MSDLLTTRQVQDILKVERITVYRMLADGRLRGVKIGQQWRFPSVEVERLLGAHAAPAAALAASDGGFPTHCVQTIQELFAEMGQISALVVDMHGCPLTETSRPTHFCQMLLSTPGGVQACQAAWGSFARESAALDGASGNRFFTCPAGLQYIGAPIYEKGAQVGLFLAGQFYWQPPEQRALAERIRRLAASYGLPEAELRAAAEEVPVIDPSQHARVESWPFTAAKAVESILHERQCFVERLQQIASLTQLA